nr:MAG TPA: cell division protein [Caudoviricetes sp.]
MSTYNGKIKVVKARPRSKRLRDIGGTVSTVTSSREVAAAPSVDLSRYVLKSTFDDLFEKVNLGTDAAPKWAIKAKYNFYTVGWLSFRGANDGSGGSAVAGAANLSDLKDVSLGSLAAGQALVWNGAKWVNSTIATSGLDEASLSNYLSSHGYATQSWANGAFVNKSGDTMTGHLTMLAKDVYLKNRADNSQYVCYGFKNTANAIIAQIGYHNTAKRIIINPVGSSEPWVDAVGKYNLIVGNNELKYNTYTLWHSGNDGHNSGLDADLLDGVHCSDMLHFVALYPQNLDANGIVTTGSCYVPRGDMNNSSWNGYTFTNFPTSKPQGGFMLMNLAEGNYRRQLYAAYNNPNLYVRYNYFNGTAVTWSPWHTLAFTDSTVANANSLGGKAAAQYVTTDTAQTITGAKTFTNYTKIEQALMFKAGSDGIYFAPSTDGSLRINTHTNYSYTGYIGRISQDGSLAMGSFIKSGGTASQFLMADGSVVTKKTATAPCDLGWVNNDTGNSLVPTIAVLAYWDGAYLGGGSNLKYCNRGRFGTMATASASDYLARSGGSMTGQLTIHNGTYNKTLVLSSAGADAKSKGPGILFNGSETDRSQGIVLRHEWYDTFTPGYGLAISRDTSLEAGDANMWLYNTGRYISKVPTGTKPIDVVSTTLCTNLNADLLDGYHVSQLARLTAANASVGAHNLPVYVNGGVVNAVSSVGEAFLSWGGQSLNGGFSPVDGAMVGALGANRFAFLKPAGTTFQYSTNSGSSWSNYNLSAIQKSGFFDAGVQQALYASGSSNVVATASHQLRVIIATSAARIYTDINKFVINFSTNGCHGTTVTIEKALESTPDSWVTVASNVPLSGWSGWNVVNVPAIRTYGNASTSQYGRIRFTFKCTSVGSSNSPFVVFCIMAYGGFGWTTASSMAANGHLYSYDGNQNAYFPACVRLNNDAHDVGTVWNNGVGQIGIALVNNSNQTPLLVAHRHGAGSDVTGANRLFALELLNSGAEMHFAFGGSTKFSMTNTGVFFADGGLWTNGFLSFKGKNTSSDARLKRYIGDIHVPLAVIAKAPNIIYAWRDDGSLDMGSIAQYWQKHLPLSVRLCQNGYLGMDYSKVALACVISMASELLGVKDDVSTLKQEVRQLKRENQQLKQQLNKMERRIA